VATRLISTTLLSSLLSSTAFDQAELAETEAHLRSMTQDQSAQLAHLEDMRALFKVRRASALERRLFLYSQGACRQIGGVGTAQWCWHLMCLGMSSVGCHGTRRPSRKRLVPPIQ
jgi:hypothetical protein